MIDHNSTPWGAAQHTVVIASGIVQVSTASHGGIWLSHERWAQLPAGIDAGELRAGNNPDDGVWLEEDCEATLAITAFPEEFRHAWLLRGSASEAIEHNLTIARQSLKDCFPRTAAILLGITIPISESRALRETQFNRDHAEDWIAVGAWGSWLESVPSGMVGVIAVKVSELASSQRNERYYLIPEDEYERRGEFGILVDTERHQTWSGPYPSRL